MKGTKKITAIILIAGNSTRYGQNINKNFDIIDGSAILLYSLNQFDKNEYIDDIIIAIKESEIEKVEEILEKNKFTKNIKLVFGGNERKDSVYNCISSSDADIVIIHDGARPMIKEEYINKCIEAMEEFKGVSIGVKSKDTIKITNENNIVINTTIRSNTWIVQTPQCFDREILLKMHEKYKNDLVTDDCMLLEKDGFEIRMIEGDYTNIKITTYEDLGIAKKFIGSNNIY